MESGKKWWPSVGWRRFAVAGAITEMPLSAGCSSLTAARGCLRDQGETSAERISTRELSAEVKSSAGIPPAPPLGLGFRVEGLPGLGSRTFGFRVCASGLNIDPRRCCVLVFRGLLVGS